MERIAVISDVHGNMPALEAVLSDISCREIRHIICLGDLIGKGPDSPAAVDCCRGACSKIVQGNWDNYISNHDKPGDVSWYRNQLGPDRLKYLAGLDSSLELPRSGRLIRLFHAHPKDVYKRVHPYHPVEERMGLFEPPPGQKGHSDVAIYGDIHHAYIQNLSGRLLLNAGSVGNPLDFNLASYIILSANPDNPEDDGLTVDFIRVPYDVEYAIRLAETADMPNCAAYVLELRTAKYARKKPES